jgi:hypothetical protein
VLFKPYEVHRQKPTDSVLYLYDFVYKELDTNRTRIELYGRKGRYVGKRFDVDEPVVIDRLKQERIVAKEGRYDKGIVTFIEDVNYTSKEYRALSDKAVYDTKKEILRIPTTFWLYAKDMNVTGKRLVYYKSSGKIVAYDIHAKVLQQ